MIAVSYIITIDSYYYNIVVSERISRVQRSSYEPVIRRPSIDIPNENTPLLTQNSCTSVMTDMDYSKSNDCLCCILQ